MQEQVISRETASLPPRVLFAATASGCGKTTVTCAVLQAMVERGVSTAAYKCGPDYIDPMFHRRCIGLPTGNLDGFFTDRETIRWLLSQSAGRQFTLVEGVMGYYDGLGLTDRASSYQLATDTDTPTVLILNCRGMSASVVPLAAGFLGYRNKSGIAGLILNQLSAGLYPALKEKLERELGIRVYGYLPKLENCSLESRHLGLVTADEVENLQQTLHTLALQAEQTIDLDGLLELAASAPADKTQPPLLWQAAQGGGKGLRIGIAQDRAFCFYYRENLALLERMGATLCPFSPLEDTTLPAHLDGLLLGGGYPEVYASALGKNAPMRQAIRRAVEAGLPTIAECGGYMYLLEELEGIDGNSYPMVGALPGRSFATGKLRRFGYCQLTAKEDNLLCKKGERIPAHEFHYWDSTDKSGTFTANKPGRTASWDAIHADGTLAAGYPHIYWHGAPQLPLRFIGACREFHRVGGSTHHKTAGKEETN